MISNKIKENIIESYQKGYRRGTKELKLFDVNDKDASPYQLGHIHGLIKSKEIKMKRLLLNNRKIYAKIPNRKETIHTLIQFKLLED